MRGTRKAGTYEKPWASPRVFLFAGHAEIDTVMKYYLGTGRYAGSDVGPCKTPYHKRITATAHIPGTRTGNWAILECGHRAQMFGEFEATRDYVLCTICQEAAAEAHST